MSNPYQPPSYPGPQQQPVPYGQYGPPSPYGMPYAPPPRTSGLAIAGMVVGIVALLGFWIPFFDIVAAVAAIGLSWGGMVQAGKPGWTGQGMGIAGLVCGILAAIPAVIFLVLFIVSLAAAGTSCAFYC
ncbi:DUF4190 domain-containing protein [Amycolatopsis jiangsuensis]|uniref:DUF4190 domain-containing protein n=1 Tax=Amycolatopsis jiangsuensis TaxID=1181879 RepID=A0A840IZH2_9PSEU|nr:DUF4190 domain-containing protein [Amycolatopsis jiangsuensis]MBB4688076.1 hypothetical protein [Amycolatopsis jiangsuensis]